MTRSVHIVERMRWMSALAGAAVLALAVGIALAIAGEQVTTPLAGASAASVPAGGSSAPLDPRIATVALHHRGRSLQAIVQFDTPVSMAKAETEARAHGRIIGSLPIIHGVAIQTTAGQARALAANPDVRSVSLNATVTSQRVSDFRFRPCGAAWRSPPLNCRQPTTKR